MGPAGIETVVRHLQKRAPCFLFLIEIFSPRFFEVSFLAPKFPDDAHLRFPQFLHQRAQISTTNKRQ